MLGDEAQLRAIAADGLWPLLARGTGTHQGLPQQASQHHPVPILICRTQGELSFEPVSLA